MKETVSGCFFLNTVYSFQLFSRYWPRCVLGARLDVSGSGDVIGHVTIRFPVGHFLFVSSAIRTV